MRLIIALFGLIFIGPCSPEATTPSFPKTKLAVFRITSAQVSNLTVTFELVCTVPEAGCWRYLRTDHAAVGFSHAVTIQGERTTADPCLQMLGSINVTTAIVVNGPGVHSFSFWAYETSLDTTITVP